MVGRACRSFRVVANFGMLCELIALHNNDDSKVETEDAGEPHCMPLLIF